MQNVTGPTLISAVTPKALVWPREPQLLISQFSIFWFDTSCKQHGERMKLTIFEGQTLNICIHDYMNININKMYIYIYKFNMYITVYWMYKWGNFQHIDYPRVPEFRAIPMSPRQIPISNCSARRRMFVSMGRGCPWIHLGGGRNHGLTWGQWQLIQHKVW